MRTAGIVSSRVAQTDSVAVDVAPLYFWIATTDGSLAVNGTRNIPVYMDFADAKSKLAGALLVSRREPAQVSGAFSAMSTSCVCRPT